MAAGALSSPMRAALAGKAAEAITLAAVAVLLPRVLGPESFGQFVLALSFVSVGAISTALGGPAMMSRFLPLTAPADRPALARALAIRIAPARIAGGVLLSLGAVAVSLAEPSVLPPLQAALCCAALWLSLVAMLLLQIGLGLGHVGPWVWRFPLENTAFVVLALVLVGPWGSDGAVAALPLAATLSLGLGLWSARGWIRPSTARIELPPRVVRFGRAQAAAGGLSQLVLRGPVPVAALIGGSVAAAEAGIAVGAAVAASLAILQLYVVSLADWAERIAAGEAAAVERDLRALTLRLTVPALLGAALAAGLSDPIVEIVFGREYAGAADALAVAVITVPLAPAAAHLLSLAALRLRPGLTVAGNCAGAVAFALAALWLAPGGGAVGACAAAAAGLGVAVIAQAALLAFAARPAALLAAEGEAG